MNGEPRERATVRAGGRGSRSPAGEWEGGSEVGVGGRGKGSAGRGGAVPGRRAESRKARV